ncbi:hypothetical protein D3C84_743740 [compost metagenome]
MPAPCADRQPGQLANRRKIVGLDELHGRQAGIERGVFAADRQVAFGKVQVGHFAGAAGRRAEADAAGIGKQVEHRLAGTVRLDPATGVAQVEKQQRILSGMASAHAIVEAPFVADQVRQGLGLGLVDRITAIDPRVALGAVVVDQQQRRIEGLLALPGQLQQLVMVEALMKALHQ